MNLKNRLKQQNKAKQHMEMEKANEKKVQGLNKENLAVSNNGEEVSQPVLSVPSVPPSQGGAGQLSFEKQQFYDDLLKKLNEVADKMVELIPSDNNHMVDLSRESIRTALADAMVPIMIEQLHELLKTRQKEQREARDQKRFEVERDGKTIILEDEALAYVTEKCYEIIDYHNSLRLGIGEWDAQTKEYNQNRKKDRAHVLSEFGYAVARMNRFKAEMKEYLDIAIANKKAHLKPAPEKPEGNNLWPLLRYWLISIPLYKVNCFLNDRYTVAFFHTAVFSVLVVLVSLIGFMAHDLAKYKVEAEKYQIARLWSYVEDGYDAKSKFRTLDALFEDEKNNRQEINELGKRIQKMYENQQKEKAGK